ncbi:hypothetical protein D3C84_968620 [compost metagenome]
MQAFMAHLAELAEHLEIRAGPGQDAPGLEQQLVEIAVKLDTPALQRVSHRQVPAGFMNAVFLVDVYRIYRQLLTKLEQHIRSVIPACCLADQQGNIQFVQCVA